MNDIPEILIPRGFRFGSAKAGLKASGRNDLALIVADGPASAAANLRWPNRSKSPGLSRKDMSEKQCES